jgi:hypothetical protein
MATLAWFLGDLAWLPDIFGAGPESGTVRLRCECEDFQ